MSNRREFLAAVTAALAAPGVARAATQDWADLGRYNDENFRLGYHGATSSVVFLGDSITYDWPADLRPLGSRNRGIPGQNSSQLLLRLHEDVLTLHPAVVHIWFEIGPRADIMVDISNVNMMCDLANFYSVKPLIAASLPRKSADPTLGPSIIAYNRWAENFGTGKRVRFIDYGPALCGPDGFVAPEYTAKGNRLNRAGYEKIAPLMRAAVKAADTHVFE